MQAPNVIPLAPRRVSNRYRAAPAQAPRAAAGVLPAGGPARPDSSQSGRAADVDLHRPLCQTCRCGPCACQRGTMGGAWIGAQVARANDPASSATFNAAAYRAASTRPARLASLRSPARIGHLADLGCRAWLLVALAALLGANLHRLF